METVPTVVPNRLNNVCFKRLFKFFSGNRMKLVHFKSGKVRSNLMLGVNVN